MEHAQPNLFLYELMGCLNCWQYILVLEIWREKQVSDGNSHLILVPRVLSFSRKKV